jgi:hypothetical protein
MEKKRHEKRGKREKKKEWTTGERFRILFLLFLFCHSFLSQLGVIPSLSRLDEGEWKRPTCKTV